MRFLTADKIYDGNTWLPNGTVIGVNDTGEIVSIKNDNQIGAEYFEGILAPGFVNVHCHLELSHMKDVIPENTGLIPFLRTIPAHRNDFSTEQKKVARHAAYEELIRNGVVAVGDIANTTDAIDLRGRKLMHFQTFVEAIGFTKTNALKCFDYALQTYNEYSKQQIEGTIIRQSIVPHAPYSVSAALFGYIGTPIGRRIISIHNQESNEENEFYESRLGGVCELLAGLGINYNEFIPTGKSSLQSYGEWLLPDCSLILVHNTFTSREDVLYAKNRFADVHWCLCPNANLYIENRLPDIRLLHNENSKICIGTDSLASNHQLSILAELVTIKKAYPEFSWEILLKWGTKNGAEALKMSETLGTIAIGKTPGILQIKNLGNSNLEPVVNRIV